MPAFRGEDKKKLGPIINELIGRVNDNTKRLRILEQRERILTSRISSLEQTMFQRFKEIENSIAGVNSKFTAQNEKIRTIENSIKEIIKQLKLVATKTKVKEIEELIQIYNPLKSNFVTREEVMNLIKKKF